MLLDGPEGVLERLFGDGVLALDALPVGESVGDGDVAGLGDDVVGAVDPSSPRIGVADLSVR